MKLEIGLKRSWLLFGTGIVRFLLAVQSPLQINCVLLFFFLVFKFIFSRRPFGPRKRCCVCVFGVLDERLAVLPVNGNSWFSRLQRNRRRESWMMFHKNNFSCCCIQLNNKFSKNAKCGRIRKRESWWQGAHLLDAGHPFHHDFCISCSNSLLFEVLYFV
jgi:hypothetical protein